MSETVHGRASYAGSKLLLAFIAHAAPFLALILLLAHAQNGFAQDFYKDKTLRFIVGQAAGGGYDTYTRTIAHFMSKHVPGNPAAVVPANKLRLPAGAVPVPPPPLKVKLPPAILVPLPFGPLMVSPAGVVVLSPLPITILPRLSTNNR